MKIQILNNKYILLLAFLLLFNACKTKKEITSRVDYSRNSAEILDDLTHNSLKYNTFYSKINVDIDFGKKSFSAGGTLKMIKDEVFQLSVQLLSVELFRMECSKDSIKLVDRYNRMYAMESIDKIKANSDFEFDFYNLQSLITNQLFVAGKKEITPADYPLFKIEKASDKALIEVKDKQNMQYMFISNFAGKIQSLYVTDKKQKGSVSCTYSDFKALQSQSFPLSMRFNLKTRDNKETKLNISFSKIELDKDMNMEFNIPSKYRQIRLLDAIESIKEM